MVIRGLSPQYNQITIDGVEMPSDVTSQNNITGGGGSLESTGNAIGDRGGALSMISSSMRGGIEVTRAITPDVEATLIGGVVNALLAVYPWLKTTAGQKTRLPATQYRPERG